MYQPPSPHEALAPRILEWHRPEVAEAPLRPLLRLSKDAQERRAAPHNLEAEQALLGAILVNNEALDRVSGFLEPHHFYDPLHQQVFETAAKLIAVGTQATPITLKIFFETAEPIDATLSVPQYLGRLAANAATIINARDYGRTIFDLSTRRQLIVVGEDVVNAAYDSPVDFPPGEQIDEFRARLNSLSTAVLDTSALVPLSDVAPQKIDWLWHRRIARGKVNLIAGQPGRGKSQLSLYMAATVSTGADWPDRAPCPLGSALIISCEDDAGDTIVPRLMAAGAERARCYTHALSDLGKDVPALEACIRTIGDVALVIIDPVTAYLGKFDGNNAPEVRRLLAPLQQMAAETNVAVVLITHPNKSSANAEPMSRVSGSGAFVAVSRSAWLVETDPQDSEGRRRILAPLKNNIGDDATGFAFRVEGVTVEGGIETSHVVFEPGTVMISAAELLKGQQESDEDRGALGEAMDFLWDFLKDGALTTESVLKAASKQGISDRTLKRARSKMKVKATKSGATGNWLLTLPEASCTLQQGQECQGGQGSRGAGIGTLDSDQSGNGQGGHERPSENLGPLGTPGPLGGVGNPMSGNGGHHSMEPAT